MKDLRIAFFGNPPLAEPVLEELHAAGSIPLLIITENDRPGRRGGPAQPAPMKRWAKRYEIDVLQPSSLKDDDVLSALYNSEWDLFLVASYGKIIPKAMLDLPKHGTLNIHPSLLPKYRGASPVRSQILADDRLCGVSVMLLDEKMDHGPILAQASIEPDPWPLPAPLLEELLSREGARLLADILPQWMRGALTPVAQAHDEATYTKKITKEDGRIDLAGDAHHNYLKYCAYGGWPGTYFETTKGGKQMRVKITEAEFKNDEFHVIKVIPEGKKEMPYEVFVRP